MVTTAKLSGLLLGWLIYSGIGMGIVFGVASLFGVWTVIPTALVVCLLGTALADRYL